MRMITRGRVLICGGLLTLIGILGLVVIPSRGHVDHRMVEQVLIKDLYKIRKAIDNYYANQGDFPNNIRDLVDRGYLPIVPIDPITGSDNSWVAIRGVSGGILDIRSGSAGLGLDGTAYCEW